MDLTPLLTPIVWVISRFELKINKLKTKDSSEIGITARYRNPKSDDDSGIE